MATISWNKGSFTKMTDNLTDNIDLVDETSKGHFLNNYLSNLNDYIKKEVANQISPFGETQKALLNATAELSIQVDSLEKENKEFASTYFENIRLKKMINNIKKIFSFKNLGYDWNGKGSEPITEKLIYIAFDFINLPNLKYQPNVYPTGRGSIQFEYHKSNGDYLEIEIFEEYFTLYSEIDQIATDKTNLTIQEILGEINAFHSRR